MNELLFGMRPSVSLDDNLRGSLADRDTRLETDEPSDEIGEGGEEARVCNLIVNEFNKRKIRNPRMQAKLFAVE